MDGDCPYSGSDNSRGYSFEGRTQKGQLRHCSKCGRFVNSRDMYRWPPVITVTNPPKGYCFECYKKVRWGESI